MNRAQRIIVGTLLFGVLIDVQNSFGDYLYWVDQLNGTNAIFRANLDQPLPVTEFELVVADVRTRAIAVDSQNGKFYWGQDEHIWRSDPDGSNAEIVLESVFPRQLAIDPYNQQLYWASESILYRANLNGTGVQTLSVFVGTPHGLALDLENEFVYWSESTTSLSGLVARRSFDVCATCVGREVIFTTSSSPQRGLGLDVAENLLLFPTDHAIMGNDLAGTNLFTVAQGLPELRGMAIDPFTNRIYWAPLAGSIHRTDYLGSSHEPVVVLTPPDANPDVLAIYFVIPEPSSPSLFALATTFVLLRRSRRRAAFGPT